MAQPTSATRHHMKIHTLHDLTSVLADLSPAIEAIDLAANTSDDPLTPPMYNFANTVGGLERVATTAQTLADDLSLPPAKLTDVLTSLLRSKTFYGAYHELGVYHWLNARRLDYEPQVTVPQGGTLNQGDPSELDGRFPDAEVYFDVKSFGFQSHLKEEFRSKLTQALNTSRVVINGSSNNALRDITTYALEDKSRLDLIVDELKRTGRSRIPELAWDLSIPAEGQSVTFEESWNNPYLLAQENRHYTFNFAKQFTLNAPFLLVFAYDHLFNGPLHVNFANHAEVLFRSLSRRAFMEFEFDTRPISRLGQGYVKKIDGTLPVREVARLLSGILFIDIDDETSRLYANPNATNKITDYRFDSMFDFNGAKVHHDDFAHDNY